MRYSSSIKNSKRRGTVLQKQKIRAIEKLLSTDHIGVWIGTLTTAAAILFFITGQSFREGYFNAFSVDVWQIPIEIHETIFWGYSTNLDRTLMFLLAIAGYLVLFAAVILILEWAMPKIVRIGRGRSTKLGQSNREGSLKPHTAKPIPKKPSFETKLIAASIGIILCVFVLAIVFFVAYDARKNGQARAELTMREFLENEIKAAEAHEVSCVHMLWKEDSLGPSREMYAYQIFCGEKLCKVFDPASKTFPTVYLDGIRYILPIALPQKNKLSCVKG